jgi:hypothetical protein
MKPTKLEQLAARDAAHDAARHAARLTVAAPHMLILLNRILVDLTDDDGETTIEDLRRDHLAALRAVIRKATGQEPTS